MQCFVRTALGIFRRIMLGREGKETKLVPQLQGTRPMQSEKVIGLSVK
jgi:hypothetical protein